jgi:hypothetical protein
MINEKSLEAAIENALGAIDRARASGMRTSSGESADAKLDRLRADLVLEAAALREAGSVNADRIRAMIRSVADWAPESDVSLLSALGAIARRVMA